MPNWGAEIPVTIVDRKPDFVGDDDVCDVWEFDHWSSPQFFNSECLAKVWNWHSGITKIRFRADHPYYTKENTMVISREAAIEAFKRSGKCGVEESEIDLLISGNGLLTVIALAKAIQELWDACPDKRPVDNRVVAMRHAWVVDSAFSGDIENEILEGGEDELMIKALATFDAKLAELEGGSE